MRIFKVVVSAVSASIVLAVGAVDKQTCGVDGCSDEASMLSMRVHTRGHMSYAQFKAQHLRDEPRMSVAQLEATKFFYMLVTDRNSPVAQAWDTAQFNLLYCQATNCANLTKECTETTCGKETSALQALPPSHGYQCTLQDILDVGTSFHTSSIESYSAVYASKNVDDNTLGHFQLYATKYKPQQVVIDGTNITNFVWTPNCGDITCVGSPNILSWNKSNGNPSAGRLSFSFVTSFDDMPSNAYNGPYFIGEISDTLDSITNHSAANMFGVIFQNDVIRCGPLPTSKQDIIVDPQTFMRHGANQACLQGKYCIQLNGSASSDLYSMTVGTDSLQLGDKVIEGANLSGSRFVWSVSAINDYSGNVLFNTNENGTKVVGKIKHRNGTLYNVSGYTPVGNQSCFQAPPVPHPGWWAKFWNGYGKTIANGGLGALGFILVDSIFKWELPALISKIYGGIKKLISRFFKNKEEAENAEPKDPDLDEHDPGAADPPPEQVDADARADASFDDSVEADQRASASGDAMDSAQDRIDKIDQLEENPNLPEGMKDQLEAQKNIAQSELEQSTVAHKQHLDEVEDFHQSAEDAAAESEKIETEDEKLKDEYNQEVEDELPEDAGGAEGSSAEDVASSDLESMIEVAL